MPLGEQFINNINNCCAGRSEFFIRAEPERERGRMERGGEKPRGRGRGQRNSVFCIKKPPTKMQAAS